ncbi:MAG: phosphoglucosamine mutase [Candidatus Omnitrophica bacterium]|nr:phosphoglucosamine mutase [Candidatus Omnitrophota bacterium]
MKLFGTDGIRGTPGVYPLTDEMLSKIGRAIAYSVKGKKSPKVIIGKDTRISGDSIEKTLAGSIKDVGVNVLLAGTITTPGLSFLTKDARADAGIMISASHNKATDNGLKFFDSNGNKFSEEHEAGIEEIIFNRFHAKGLSAAKKGRVLSLKNAQAKYTKFLISTVKGLDLKGIKVALDCAWGAASGFGSKVFSQVGAKVHTIHDKPTGHNINEGGAINPGLLRDFVLKTKADIGVAVDGDGDRGILIDEQGNVVDGDCILAVIARYLMENNNLPKKTVVGTVMSNYGLKVSLEQVGAKIITTSVGDKYVLEALLDNNLPLGGEQSGHIIFLNFHSSPDGLLTALQMLNIMKKTKTSLSELCKCMTKFPQILLNIKVTRKIPFEEMPRVQEQLKRFNGRLKDEGRILLRYSGTELLARVMVEGRDKGLIEEIAHSLAGQIKNEIGA